MTTTQNNSDGPPSVTELMVEIKKYWTTATGEPELKEFAEYVQEIIQSRELQLEQRVLEAIGKDEMIHTATHDEAMLMANIYAACQNSLRAKLRAKLKGMFHA